MKNTLTLKGLHRPILAQLNIATFKFRRLLSQYPKGTLALMCAVLLTSLVLCFTVLRHSKTARSVTDSKFKKNPGGIEEIGGAITAASALSQVLLLQSELNGRLSAKHISAKDSTRIGEIINQIKILQSNISADEKVKP